MPSNDLEVLLRSRVPIVVVESRDEARVLKSLAGACAALSAPPAVPPAPAPAASRTGLPLFQWTVTDGLKRLDVQLGPPQRMLAQPAEVLEQEAADASRASGHTWTEIAGVYGMSKQAAQQRFRAKS